MQTVLLIIAVAMTFATAFSFAAGASTGILMMFFAKPFIDAAWSSQAGDISPGRLFGVLVPTLILIDILRKKKLSRVPLIGMWMIYIANGVFIALYQGVSDGLMEMVQNLYRTLNGLVGFLMIQLYFSEKADFRRLLLVMIAAGMFPLGVGIYQAITGVVWIPDVTLTLMRYSGFFHDVQSVRTHVLQTFTALILYWAYFKPEQGRAVKRILVLGIAAVGSVVLFRTYSKAAMVTAAAWMVVWGWGRRQLAPLAGIAAAILVTGTLFYPQMWTELDILFSRETAALESSGTGSEELRQRSFAGRWVVWDAYLDEFSKRPAFEQVIGNGRWRAAHNDYLGTLLAGGFVGLILYVTLLVAIGLKVLKLYIWDRSPLNVMAVMLYATWIIDTLGLVPRLYPGYQWYVWGFVGLALARPAWAHTAARVVPPRRQQQRDAGDAPPKAEDNEEDGEPGRVT